MFDTTYSEVGALLHRLKYNGDTSVVPDIVTTAAGFLTTWNPTIDVIVPVPATRSRMTQPVALLASALGTMLTVPVVDAVKRIRDLPELKNVSDYDERLRLLAGAYDADTLQVRSKHVLLLDDLYRSGATMNAIATVLYDVGGAADVVALTVTRTRTKQ